MSDTVIRCPACGQRVLPMQSHCRHCDARLPKASASASPKAQPATYGLAAEQPQDAEGRCRGCGGDMPPEAVLCVQCGYDRRIGTFRTKDHHENAADAATSPRRPRRLDRIETGQLRLVLRGLTLHNARLLLGLLGLLLIVGLQTYAIVKRVPAKDPPDWLVIAAGIGNGLWLLAIVLGFLGSICCLVVPRASRGGLPIQTSLTFDIVSVGLGVAAAILGWTPLLALAFGLVSWALFMVFLVRLARYIERPSEAREARTILVYGLLLVVLPALAALAVTLAVDDQPEGNPNGGIKTLIAVLMPISAGLFVRIQLVVIRLLESLRDSLRQQVEAAGRNHSEEISAHD